MEVYYQYILTKYVYTSHGDHSNPKFYLPFRRGYFYREALAIRGKGKLKMENKKKNKNRSCSQR